MRFINKLLVFILCISILTNCQKREKKEVENWVQVFNGKDLSGCIVKISGEEVISYSNPIIGGDFNTIFKEGDHVKSDNISLQRESHPIGFKKIELLPL